MSLQNIEGAPGRMPLAVSGACGECGAEGPVHDFHGDFICAQCREKEDDPGPERPTSRATRTASTPST